MPSSEKGTLWGLVEDISNYTGIRSNGGSGSSTPVMPSLMDGIEDTVLRIEIHNLLLAPEIINANSMVRVECGESRTHFSIRDSIRECKHKHGRNGTLVIRMRCSPWNYNLHVFVSTEGILSNSVSAQIIIPLRQLLNGEINKKRYTFWNFPEGKHLKLYETGIPQVPGSALKRPREVGEIELCLRFEQLPEKWLIYSRAPLRFSVGADSSHQLEIDGLSSRLTRLMGRLHSFVRTPPRFFSTVLLPIFEIKSRPLTTVYVVTCYFLCFMTPVYLLPADIVLLLFVLSVASKVNGTHTAGGEYVCWDGDERLLEPPGGPNTFVGQLLESKKLLVSALAVAEYVVSAVEATSTLFCWVDPICTCAAFFICYISSVAVSLSLYGVWCALQLLSIHSWMFMLLMAPFAVFRVSILRKFFLGRAATYEELLELMERCAAACPTITNLIRTTWCMPAVPEQENAYLASLQATECRDRSHFKPVPFPIQS